MKNNNRKQEIIESCISLICKNGFDTASMQNIADETGISKSSLYFYFDSKETIFKEVYEYCHKLYVDACNQGISGLNTAIIQSCIRH